MTKPIQFIDLAAQQATIREKLDVAIAKVLDHGAYIMGPEVGKLEKQLAEFAGAKHCLSCSNGTDALGLVLMAKNVGAGDAVFVPTFTFAATAEVVAWVGATAFFVDVLPETFNMCPTSLKQAIATAQKQGLKPACVMPVDLFGLPADYDQLLPIAQEHGMWVLCDAAQGFGGTYKGKKVGSMGLATSTSFVPAKPLGCYGDGGAVFTDDDELYNIMVSLRVHGKGDDKYDNVRIGMNGRLDTLQAASLIVNLAIFPQELIERQRVAELYNAALCEHIVTPQLPTGLTSAWAQYTLIARTPAQREQLQSSLKAAGIPTMVYYPKPLHQQTAYRHYPTATGGALPVSEDLANRVFSLPIHPYLDNDTIDRITAAVREALIKVAA
jgi:dTDP-4-amino-4,6-dideoxygalactose transaminase